MKFFDVNKQNDSLANELRIAIEAVIKEGNFILGVEVKELEHELACFCGTKHAIGVNSGTDALLLSLMALEIGEGDEVITSPFTFIATAEVIANLGARPVFADIDAETFNLNPQEVKKKINQKTKAIIPVHIFGQVADMTEIMLLARDNDLKVIEDAAQAIGAEYQNQRAGSIGDCGCFSFFPTKNLGGFGDGGLITLNDDEVTFKLKMLRAHGSSPQEKYRNMVLGMNSRLDTLQAAVLRVKLRYLMTWNQKRQKNAAVYTEELGKISEVKPPVVREKRTHIFHQYTVRAQRRDELMAFLKSQGIPAMIYYSLPLHLQPAFEYLGYREGDFPVAERMSKEVVSLPIYPELKLEDGNKVVEKIKEFYER